MEDNKFDYMVKLLIIGNSGVGKTCILTQFTKGQFTESHLTTIGIDFMSKVIQVDNKKIKLQIWDTAGQDRFQNITQTYYKGASGIILTYACDDKESLNNISTWNKSIDEYAGANIVRLLIGNKTDVDDRCVDYEEGKEIADKYGIQFFETSAKNNENINEAFHAIAKEICVCIENDKITPVTGPGVNNGQQGMRLNARHKRRDKQKGGCCKK